MAIFFFQFLLGDWFFCSYFSQIITVKTLTFITASTENLNLVPKFYIPVFHSFETLLVKEPPSGIHEKLISANTQKLSNIDLSP